MMRFLLIMCAPLFCTFGAHSAQYPNDQQNNAAGRNVFTHRPGSDIVSMMSQAMQQSRHEMNLKLNPHLQPNWSNVVPAQAITVNGKLYKYSCDMTGFLCSHQFIFSHTNTTGIGNHLYNSNSQENIFFKDSYNTGPFTNQQHFNQVVQAHPDLLIPFKR